MPDFVNISLVILMLFLLLLFTVVLLHKGRAQYANVLLAVYLVSQIIGVANAVLKYGFPGLKEATWYIYPVIYTWAPLFYFYIMALMFADYRVNVRNFWQHFIPAFFIFLLTLFFQRIQEMESPARFGLNMINLIYGLVFNVQIIGYNIAAFIQYYHYTKKLKEEYSVIDQAANSWLKTSLFGFMAACFIVQISRYTVQAEFISAGTSFFISNLAFFAFFNLLFYKAIISPNILTRSFIKEKYKHSALGITEANKILNTLEQFMDDKKPFSDANLSLRGLSVMTEIPERYLSQVINEHREQNFFDFVNSYRVKYAMSLLSDKANSRRTMFDIMFDAGFNSKSTFNAAFKKHAGLTPSDFKKQSN